jgi:hypothetical protein
VTHDALREGKTYLARHASGMLRVRLERIYRQEPFRFAHAPAWVRRGRTTTRYICTNLKTGREVRFKSATKFVQEVIA